MIENNWLFNKIYYTSKYTGWEKKNDFVIFILQFQFYSTKTVFKTKSNATFNMKEIDLDKSQLNR